MHTFVLNVPTFGFAVATRAAIGVGVGLLLADRLPADRRRRLAIALLTIGAATTVPIVNAIIRGSSRANA
jgi:hypothetical protein